MRQGHHHMQEFSERPETLIFETINAENFDDYDYN